MPKTQVLAHPCSRAVVRTNKGSNTVEVIQQTQRQRSKPLDAFFMGVASVWIADQLYANEGEQHAMLISDQSLCINVK